MSTSVTIRAHNQGAYTTVQAILIYERLQQLCASDASVHFVNRLDTPHFSYTITYRADAPDQASAQKVRAAMETTDALKDVRMAPHTTAFLTLTCDAQVKVI